MDIQQSASEITEENVKKSHHSVKIVLGKIGKGIVKGVKAIADSTTKLCK